MLREKQMADFQIDDDGRVLSAEKAPHHVLCQDHINIELPVSTSASETVSGFSSHRHSLAFRFFIRLWRGQISTLPGYYYSWLPRDADKLASASYQAAALSECRARTWPNQ